MLELLKERKEWAKNECEFPMHFHLIQIMVYAPSNGFIASTYPTEEELEFYAKHEQSFIDSFKP
jgi:hypothetical protein